MTFTPWLRILESTDATPAAPYAKFSAYFTRYHAAWREPSWRYDRSTGEIEYRGLVAVKTGQTAPAAAVNMLTCDLPAYPNLPKPPLHMHMAISSYASGVINEVVRIDCNPGSGPHHGLNVDLTGGNAMGAGNWIWIGGVNISCGTTTHHNPLFYPWAGNNAQYGQVSGGTYFNYYGGWADYPGWLGAQVRTSLDSRRHQWRGLIQNTGAAASGHPTMIDVAHPAPLGGLRVINSAMVNHVWAGGQAGSMRIDALPHSYGYQIILIGIEATSAWIPLNLDFMIAQH